MVFDKSLHTFTTYMQGQGFRFEHRYHITLTSLFLFSIIVFATFMALSLVLQQLYNYLKNKINRTDDIHVLDAMILVILIGVIGAIFTKAFTFPAFVAKKLLEYSKSGSSHTDSKIDPNLKSTLDATEHQIIADFAHRPKLQLF